ncbi:hypothetical protein [Chitinophaga agri]|uniref:Uncharacterized protein n=1 Tax=Chitinophaga agri TaxID=2703787 RepID=A0A6B9ZN54_9BACT|nr:hypothetical protein [Chitinophaga agri]QHS63436.1 hypothetical protein GWR21_28765 [Chitinophaga agri]
MTQIWTSSKGDKIIAFANNTLYKANPKDENVSFLVAGMKAGDFSDPALFALPLDIIRSIHWQEGNDHIQVFFSRESEEHFIIKDPVIREEIFNHLKAYIPGATYGVDRYDEMRAAAKPLAGLVVVLLLFAYTIHVMAELNSGESVTAFGRLGGLIVGLVSLGTVKVLLVYGALIAIAGYSTYKKMRNPPVVHVIGLGRPANI